MSTTISVDPGVRDRLRGYCPPGTSYSEALTRLMDLVEEERFFASFRGAIDDPSFPWVDEDAVAWD